MRRVLSVATLYPNAADPRFGTFVARSLEALSAHGGWKVTAINPIGVPPIRSGRYARMAQMAGTEGGDRVQIHRLLFPILPGLSGRWNARSIARTVMPLARRLHAETPFDLVDAQFFFPDGPAAAAIARELHLPLAIKARGADIQYWGQKGWCRRQILSAGEQAAGLLAVSQALADNMAAIGLPGEKIAIHHTGLDHTHFRPLGRDQARLLLASDRGIRLGEDQVLLASVGALIPRKGQRFAIEALPDLPQAVLALIGKGPDEAMLRTLSARLDVAERVHFLGSLDHEALPQVLSAAHAMVLPSASEGLANAWIEALACGAPLVISDAGGAREVVTDRAAGRIVARDPFAIAAGVKDLLADPPTPEAVAAHAARFDWKRHGEELAAFYERLV